jgi:hypothetical protein
MLTYSRVSSVQHIIMSTCSRVGSVQHNIIMLTYSRVGSVQHIIMLKYSRVDSVQHSIIMLTCSIMGSVQHNIIMLTYSTVDSVQNIIIVSCSRMAVSNIILLCQRTAERTVSNIILLCQRTSERTVSNIIPVKRISQSTKPYTQLFNSSTEIYTVGFILLCRQCRSPSIAQCGLYRASCTAARRFVLLIQIQHIDMQYETRRESFNEEPERYNLNKFLKTTHTWRHERWIMKFSH